MGRVKNSILGGSMIVKPYRLVIIDDEASVAEVLQMQIKDAFEGDLEIKVFNDAKQAFDFMKNNSVEIVITDIHMPEMYGDSILQELKKFNKHAQVIMVSGDTSKMTVTNCYLDGARFFLSKPFESSLVIELVNQCVYQLDWWLKLLQRQKKEK
jgi:DNA-binding NtrC family response regulator